MIDATCSVDGCGNKALRQGKCRKHLYPNGDKRRALPCSVEGCTGKVYARGLCGKHYSADRAKLMPCSVDGCNRGYVNKGLCSTHYRRLRKGQDLLAPMQTRKYSLVGRWDDRWLAPPGAKECWPCARWFIAPDPTQLYCSRDCKNGRPFGRPVLLIKWCQKCGKGLSGPKSTGLLNKKYCQSCARSVKTLKENQRKNLRRGRGIASEMTGAVTVEDLRRLLGDRCHLCGKKIDFSLPPNHPLSVTEDHLIPISLPGSWHGPGNVALAHRRCNSRKGNRWADAPMLPLVFADAG